MLSGFFESKAPIVRPKDEIKSLVPVPTHKLQGRRPQTGRGRGLRKPVPRQGPRRRPGKTFADTSLRDVANVAQKAWQASKYIMSMINVETKMYDVGTSQAVSSTPSMINLSNIGQGNDIGNREGDSVLAQSFDIQYFLTVHASATTTFVRVIIFKDKETHAVDPAAGELLQTAASPDNIVAPYLNVSGVRFQVFHDVVHSLVPANDSAAQYRRFSTKLHHHIRYQATSGADASNWEGAMYMLVVSNEATNTPTFRYYGRLGFTDN